MTLRDKKSEMVFDKRFSEEDFEALCDQYDNLIKVVPKEDLELVSFSCLILIKNEDFRKKSRIKQALMFMSIFFPALSTVNMKTGKAISRTPWVSGESIGKGIGRYLKAKIEGLLQKLRLKRTDKV